MSRIGKKPITLPNGVKISESAGVVTVEGPKGTLSRKLPAGLKMNIDGTTVTFETLNDANETRALHGLIRTLVDNMVVGVSQGFVKTLEIVGVGYKVALKGRSLDFNVGKSHPTVLEAPEGVEFTVEGNNKIHVKGVDKELVGQVAANVRMIRKPEPYKGKGIRYQGEHIIMKAGKTGKK